MLSVAVLNGVVRVGLTAKLTGSRLEGAEGFSHAHNWGDEYPRQRKHLCKVPEAGFA